MSGIIFVVGIILYICNTTLIHKYFKIKHLALFLFWAGTVNAQFTPKLNRFSAQHREGIVYLDWVMASGSVCLGINIEKSDDSVNFTEIGSIGGICGNLTKPMAYAFQDESPMLNKKIYYRLSYPGLGHSNFISIVVIDVKKNDYEVNPNPSPGASKINFYNPKGELHHIKILNLSGVQVAELETTNEVFELESGLLEAGIYQFMIYNDSLSNVVNGRLIIAQ